MRRFSRSATTLFFDPRAAPLAEVAPGERFVVETADSLCGMAKQQAPRGWDIDDVLSRLGGACPVTGPFYVTGATPSDVLSVRIERVTPMPVTGEGWTGVFTGFGALTHEHYSLQEPLEPVTMLVPYDEQEATLTLSGRDVRIPLHPFVGTIGVAPLHERRLSFSQSPEYVGDIDQPGVTAGATLVMPVNVPGALLALGDAHAVQGDGEITGAGVEIEAEVELVCQVTARDATAYVDLPQLNTAVTIGSVCGLAGNDLTYCARAAYRDLVLRLERFHGITRREAYQLLGQVGRLQIGNMIDPFYSVVASVERRFVE